MADKKNNPDNEPKNGPSESSELASLRHLVFGAAKADIEQQINALSQRTNEHFHKLEQEMTQHVKNLRAAMDDGFQQLSQQLALADQAQDQKAAELNVYADKLSSEIELADANNKQENDELHSRLDKEIALLTTKFNEQLNQALAQLNQVSSELNTNKTDRKTLAKLLATVATNLEIDDSE
jgi:exonuclease VII large subunit